MKLTLQESKELLPTSFLTDLVSRGWEDIGLLKAKLEGIQQEFSGTKKIEDAIQNLIDSYLIFIGQIELQLATKDHLDYPEDSGLGNTFSEPIKENLVEDLTTEDININVNEINFETETDDDLAKKLEKVTLEEPISTEKDDTELDTDFKYFCDFDEPDLTTPKLTDDDLYSEN